VQYEPRLSKYMIIQYGITESVSNYNAS
jgi:hypothetical protein